MTDRMDYRLPMAQSGGPLMWMVDTGQTVNGESVYALGNVDASSAGAKYASFPGSVGTNDIVAAVPGKKIRLLACLIKPANSATVQLLSGATVLSATLQLAGSLLGGTDTSIVLPYCPVGWMETNPGDPLRLTVGTAAAPGILVYKEITP